MQESCKQACRLLSSHKTRTIARKLICIKQQTHPKMIKIAILFALAASSITLSAAYTPSPVPSSRSQFLKTIVASAAAATILPSSSFALDKQLNLPPNEIAAIVEKDLVENAFLTNGKLTRSIYDEKAIFTDEIDKYGLDQWIKGTSKLFVGPPGSRVALVGPVEANEKEVVFRFEEDLMFNIPFKPVVALSGKVVLERDEKSGLITSYREFWDQDVKTVLKSAKFR
jgi:hypothetical protein